jgi:hypothetical protein
MKQTINHSGYAVKNIKQFKGMEGEGFNATVYYNGVKLGEVRNLGDGGCNLYYIPHSDMKILENTAKWIVGEGYEVEDQFINQIIDDTLSDKCFRRDCKTKVLFRVKGDKEGSIMAYNTKYTPEFAQKIRNDYKNKGMEIEEILNELYA